MWPWASRRIGHDDAGKFVHPGTSHDEPAVSGGTGGTDSAQAVPAQEAASPQGGSLDITDPVWKKYAEFMGLTGEHVALVHELWGKFDPKAAWTAHWEAFTGGRVDDAYIASRLKMGEAHVRVSLGQAWYLAAYTWMFDMLTAAAIETHRGDPERLGQAIDALFRLVSLDMQAGVQAYIDETLRLRDEREEELARLRQEAERREDEAVGSSTKSKGAVDAVLEKLQLITDNTETTLAGFADVSDGLRSLTAVAREISEVSEAVAAQAAELAAVCYNGVAQTAAPRDEPSRRAPIRPQPSCPPKGGELCAKRM